MEHDLHMFMDTLPVSRSDIGVRIWTRKILVRHENVNRRIDGTYAHHYSHWLVLGGPRHHSSPRWCDGGPTVCLVQRCSQRSEVHPPVGLVVGR